MIGAIVQLIEMSGDVNKRNSRKMSSNKDEMLSCIEDYLRDRSKNGLYNAYDYIGDFLSVQDLIMAEQDTLYMDYLVVKFVSIIHDWSVARIKCMAIDLGIDLASKGD